MTWDALLRHALSNDNSRLNVLVHDRHTFRFKLAQADTNLFAHFSADQIILPADQEKFFVEQGYNISAWRSGERLVLNSRQPMSKTDEVVGAALASIASKRSDPSA